MAVTRRSFSYGWRTLARGITWDRYHQRWTARVKAGGMTVLVGRFVSLTTAVEERMKREEIEAALRWNETAPDPPSLVGCIEERMAAEPSPIDPLVAVMERRRGSRALKED